MNEKEITINSYTELTKELYAYEPTEASMTNRVYKGTNCGAFLKFIDGGIVLGSVVEGVDYGTENYELIFPFTTEEFWTALIEIEREAKQIWNDTHGCDFCSGPCNCGYYDKAVNLVHKDDCVGKEYWNCSCGANKKVEEEFPDGHKEDCDCHKITVEINFINSKCPVCHGHGRII
jgi:hypothetical protein